MLFICCLPRRMSELAMELVAQHQVRVAIRGDAEHTVSVSQKCIQHIPTLRTAMIIDSTEQIVTFSADMIPGGFVTLACVVDYVRAMCETTEPTSVPRTNTIPREPYEPDDTDTDVCLIGLSEFLNRIALFQSDYIASNFLSLDRQECVDSLRNTILAAEYLQVTDLVCLLATVFVYACLPRDDFDLSVCLDDLFRPATDQEQQSYRQSVFPKGPVHVRWLRNLFDHTHPKPLLSDFIHTAISHNAWDQLVWSPSDAADANTLILFSATCRRREHVAWVRDALIGFDDSWKSSRDWTHAFDAAVKDNGSDRMHIEWMVDVFGSLWHSRTIDRLYTCFIQSVATTGFEHAGGLFEMLYTRFPHPFQPLDDAEVEDAAGDAEFRAKRQAFPLLATDFEPSFASVTALLRMRARDMWTNAIFVNQVVVPVVLKTSTRFWNCDFHDVFLWWMHLMLDVGSWQVDAWIDTILQPLHASFFRNSQPHNRDLAQTASVVYGLTMQPRFVAHPVGLEWIRSTSAFLNSHYRGTKLEVESSSTTPAPLDHVRHSCMMHIVHMCTSTTTLNHMIYLIAPKDSYAYSLVETVLTYFPNAFTPAQQSLLFNNKTLADVNTYPHLWWLYYQRLDCRRLDRLTNNDAKCKTTHETLVVSERDFDGLASPSVVGGSALSTWRLKIDRFRKLFANPAWSAFSTEMLRNVFEPLLLTAREHETRMIRRRHGERNRCWFGLSNDASTPKTADLKRKFECVE
jgi:hypothetical protein